MPKVLCLTGMVIAILVLLLFAADLVMALSGMALSAPFKGASIVTDVLFVIAAAILIYAAVSTYREQK
ncbi:MAG: hypothetical protein KatS3mg111_3571 [Pirellulaceae bacterium]|nr:MAG: hypothetical protein KatS3mg111_3571 [Pirellulaceae bacterium]